MEDLDLGEIKQPVLRRTDRRSHAPSRTPSPPLVTGTVDGSYKYNETFTGISYREWAYTISRRIYPNGSYMLDSLVSQAARAAAFITVRAIEDLETKTPNDEIDVNGVAEAMHTGWCENYRAWVKRDRTFQSAIRDCRAQAKFRELESDTAEQYRRRAARMLARYQSSGSE